MRDDDWKRLRLENHKIDCFCDACYYKEQYVLTAEALAKISNIPVSDIPACPDCKMANIDGHYDAEHQICDRYERAMSEAAK